MTLALALAIALLPVSSPETVGAAPVVVPPAPTPVLVDEAVTRRALGASSVPLLAGSADGALRVCCWTGLCAAQVIDDANLSPSAKTFAFTAAMAFGTAGVIIGAVMTMSMLSTGRRTLDALDRDELDVVLTIAFLTGAVFTVAGAFFGLTAGALADRAATALTERRVYEMGGGPPRDGTSRQRDHTSRDGEHGTPF